jgi:hypothetical protein
VRRLQLVFTKVFAADYCPLYLHWPLGRPLDTSQRLRRCASRQHFHARPWGVRWALKLLMTGIWPLRVLLLTWRCVRKCGATIAARTGKPRWQQAWEQNWLALRHGVPPGAYYQYALYCSEQRPLAACYLHQQEASSLFGYLNRYQGHVAIEDKRAFARLCAYHGLPTPPVLALDTAHHSLRERGPEMDLFLKPARGARGEGAMIWRFLGEGHYGNHNGRTLSWTALCAMVEALGRQKAYMIQPYLRNHPTVADLSPGALCTVRIVTGRTPAGVIEVIGAVFKMALGQQITNTYGIFSSIELANGVLGRAVSYGATCPGYDLHPATRGVITGRTIPYWGEIVVLAQAAHRFVHNYVFLGWDVALTTDGPVLLEGNSGWDVLTMQKPQGTPLGHTRFGDLCAMWMERR